MGDLVALLREGSPETVGTRATDISVNKYLLKLSPQATEFRRSMLYAVKPVGVVAFVAAFGWSIAMYFHALGDSLQPHSPVAAAVIAFVLTPLMAVATKGRYYLRRTDDGITEPILDADGNPSAVTLDRHACHQPYERPDLAADATHDAVVCSLCLSTDKVGDHVLPHRSVVETARTEGHPRVTSSWEPFVPLPAREG